MTLSGYVYYTTPAPPYYTPPPACTLGVELCSSLSGYSIVGSSPTTFTISATTEIMSGVIPASQLVPTPSCSIGEATCSKLLDAGIVWFDDWASKDWRNCEMTPPGIGPVALTPTDFLLPPPPTPTKANTAAPPTTKRRTSTLPQPTATGLESEPLGYLIPASALVPGEESAPAAATAPPRAAATALPQSQTLTLVVSAPGDGRLSTTVLALALAPAPTPSAIATLAGQPVLFDPAAGVRVGSFPIAAGAPAVNVGGTLVRVLPGGAAVVVGGQTVRLPGVATAAAVPVATVGGVVVYADGTGEGGVAVGGKGLGGAVVMDGLGFWVVGGKGARVEAVEQVEGGGEGQGFYEGVVVVGGRTYTAAPATITAAASVVVVGGKTISVGGRAATLTGGDVASAVAGGIVVGGKTYSFPTATVEQVVTIGGSAVTAEGVLEAMGLLTVGGKTLAVGGGVATVNGLVVSAAEQGVVVGSSRTVSLTATAGGRRTNETATTTTRSIDWYTAVPTIPAVTINPSALGGAGSLAIGLGETGLTMLAVVAGCLLV